VEKAGDLIDKRKERLNLSEGNGWVLPVSERLAHYVPISKVIPPRKTENSASNREKSDVD
jgi:hypothetical protein